MITDFVCVCVCVCGHAYVHMHTFLKYWKVIMKFHKIARYHCYHKLLHLFVLRMCMQVNKKNALPAWHPLHTHFTWKLTYFCLSALYCWVQSSNSFWFISIKSFSALYINPWIVLQQNQHIYTYCRRRQVQSMCVCVCVCVHMRTHAYLLMSVCRHYYLYVYMTPCVGLSECLTTCELTSA